MVKIVKTPTVQSLGAAALHYLERYAASEASLRRVLVNRIRRAALSHAAFAADDARQEELYRAIEVLVGKYKKMGVINDAAFAEMKVGSLRRQGKSRRAIVQKLAQQGVAERHVRQALAEKEEALAPDEGDLQAARVLAKRRRLGVFRTKPCCDDAARKDLAALARAGFSLDVARRALAGEED
ncbi:MAG: regulatory protein RecX [Alphaproteobacteria bacterium]|nr:regulatory protein RecX [Alphaproteobacteria bacterium]